MKTIKITLIFSAMLMASLVIGQNGVLQNTPTKKVVTEENYKAHAEGWLVDMDEAYEISKKTGKPIMANFTGSDWCGWCIKLKREVFNTKEFKAWAEKNVVLVELDFPRRFKIPEKYQQQNYALQKAFNVSGYPTIWVFNLGKDDNNQYTISALGKTGYVKGAANFMAGVDKMIEQGKNAQ